MLFRSARAHIAWRWVNAREQEALIASVKEQRRAARRTVIAPRPPEVHYTAEEKAYFAAHVPASARRLPINPYRGGVTIEAE